MLQVQHCQHAPSNFLWSIGFRLIEKSWDQRKQVLPVDIYLLNGSFSSLWLGFLKIWEDGERKHITWETLNKKYLLIPKTHTSGDDCSLKSKANVILPHCRSPSAGRFLMRGWQKRTGRKYSTTPKLLHMGLVFFSNKASFECCLLSDGVVESRSVWSAADLWFETNTSWKACYVKCSFSVLMKGASSLRDTAVWLDSSDW